MGSTWRVVDQNQFCWPYQREPKDSLGNILETKIKKIEKGINNEFKAKASLLAIDMEKNIQVEWLYLEGDLKIIINAIVMGRSQYERSIK